ncbi:MAG: hypothetical protein V7L29_13270 [Nostoc sp.]|uniref:hypothetical protein n=1 Tax=Nostoc sp. TaxID=1180 RepID=UPI002FFA7B13
MAIVLTDSLKKLLIETASQLKGAAKRKFREHPNFLTLTATDLHLIERAIRLWDD